jgi:long-chain acyl-CoA synthetase
MALGFKRGDKIATVSNNRPEWNFLDMGMMQAGIVHVPIYPTISLDEYSHILNHSDVKAIIISDKILYGKLKNVIQAISKIEHIYTINEVKGVKNWTEITETGKKHEASLTDELIRLKQSISPNEMATLIYTSGTTGSSKGVMLSHQNIVSNFIATSKIQPLDSNHKVLSFLPLCHIYERMMNYHFQYKGISIYYAESLGSIADNLREIKADGFNTVPRLLERVYDRIVAKGKDLPAIQKRIFNWALNLGLRYELNGQNGPVYEAKRKIADKLVFSKWRAGLGGNVRIIVSGGSALQPRLSRLFWAAGMKIMEGYGLTETGPVIAVSHSEWPNLKFGTVGPILENVDVKIADDGEILTKGPNQMLGYYKDPDYTKEVIDDEGWFHTGDIGVLDEGKFLKITDRKKEIFKLSSGKYVAPQLIENLFKESIFIEQIMVVGENEKFASALISPNFNHLHFWASKHKVHFRDNNELVTSPKVTARYQKEVEQVNKKLGDHEKIKRFRLVCEEWSPQTGELSPTLKLKRMKIYNKYDKVLRTIYNYPKNGDNGGK